MNKNSRYNRSAKGRTRSKRYNKSLKGIIRLRVRDYQRKARKFGCADDLKRADLYAVYNHFKGECAYCGEPVPRYYFDHVSPMRRGGPNTKRNLVTCCIECNKAKADRNLFGWFEDKKPLTWYRAEKLYAWVDAKLITDLKAELWNLKNEPVPF